MVPTKEENDVRQRVIDRICAVIQQHLPMTFVNKNNFFKYLFFFSSHHRLTSTEVTKQNSIYR